jgi:alpha-tubulin suppressor-like RCC1 family protein
MTPAAACRLICISASLALGCRQTHVVLHTDAGGGDGGGQAGPANAVSQARAHTCALADGALYCWGDNSNGQLGLGDTHVQQTPARVGADADWRTIVAADSSSYALKRDGSLWSWGRNDSGQLGLGDFTDRPSPTRVGARSDWTTVASRFFHACALTSDGALWCWGKNAEGQLGQNDASNLGDLPAPTQVTDARDWVATDAGDGHSCGLRSDGTLWCWGRNSEAELAQPDGAPIQIRHPVQVGDGTDWLAVSAGQNSSCGLRGGGALVCWGSNANTALPIASDGAVITAPTEISTPPGLTAVMFNTFGGCVLAPPGQALCWGRNEEGQLGLGDTTPRLLPTALPGDGWTGIATGRFSFCGLRAGQIVCTGDNRSGQLGDGTTNRRNTLAAVALP